MPRERNAVSLKERTKAAELDAQEAAIVAVCEDFFKRFAAGEALSSIARSLVPQIPDWRVRSLIMRNRDLADRYDSALLERAHGLVESAVEYGRRSADIGDSAALKVAIDVNLKVASKIAPNVYGDKTNVELTGKNGAPVKIMTMTDEQLLEIAAQNAKGRGE
jgi:hypothetical protein